MWLQEHDDRAPNTSRETLGVPSMIAPSRIRLRALFFPNSGACTSRIPTYYSCADDLAWTGGQCPLVHDGVVLAPDYLTISEAPADLFAKEAGYICG